jgi:hypothetical protein
MNNFKMMDDFIIEFLTTHDFIKDPRWSIKNTSSKRDVYVRFICSKCNSIFDRAQYDYENDYIFGYAMYPFHKNFFCLRDVVSVMSCDEIILKSILE